MPDQPTGDGAHYGDEARKLLALVQDWAQRNLPEPPSGHPGPECQWCPLCQFASVLRGEHPELTERAAEAGSAVVNALRALIDSAANRAGTPESGAAAGAASRVQHIRLDDDIPPAPSRPAPKPGVQRIHLDDDPE